MDNTVGKRLKFLNIFYLIKVKTLKISSALHIDYLKNIFFPVKNPYSNCFKKEVKRKCEQQIF